MRASSLRFIPTDFAGVVLVEPERHADERGYFARSFCTEEFAAAGLTADFPQSSLSFNRVAGTVRGMHFQRPPHAETKLVRCARGAIFDVVVDLRPGEATNGQWRGFELTAENSHALYIPPGLAHGFQTLEDASEVLYMITPAFRPGQDDGLRPDDPTIGLSWPLPVSVISGKDRAWPLLGDRV